MLTRFAPAPTGKLHLGHVANAIYVWGLARQHGAEVLLRMEDHDRQRSRQEYEAQVLDDLDWLGFVPDCFPTAAFRAGRCESRQSDRVRFYEAAARKLSAQRLVYGCTCSRQTAGAVPSFEARAYPGTCRTRGIPLTGEVAWRLRIDSGHESFTDLLAGPHVQNPAALGGDPVIRDRRGNWTYQFAVAVDDMLQNIGLVVRGRDLLASTGLQMRVARMLGRMTPARFAHHPLIMKSPDQKLSKSDGDTGVDELRAAGLSAAEIIGEAALRAGLASSPRPIEARDVRQFFASAAVGRGA